MLADQYGLTLLIDYLAGLDHDSMVRPLRVIALFLDRDLHVQSVSNKDGVYEAQTVVSVRHSMRVDDTCCHTDPDAEDQCPVRNPMSKRLRTAPFLIHVVRIEISRLAGMQNNVRLGDRSSARYAVFFRLVFVKVHRRHSVHSSRAKERVTAPPCDDSACQMRKLILLLASALVKLNGMSRPHERIKSDPSARHHVGSHQGLPSHGRYRAAIQRVASGSED